MTATIRPATTTEPDAVAFAHLANMASHGIIASLLGPTWHDILVAMYRDDATLYRPRQVWFAIEDGEIAGMLCGFSGEDKATLNEATDRYFIDAPVAADPAVTAAAQQLAPISRQIDTVPPTAWYIQFLAVWPERRGKGIARLLLHHAIDIAREGGTATVELDVEVGNESALAAYHRAGFTITETSPTVRFDMQERDVGLHRMVRPAE